MALAVREEVDREVVATQLQDAMQQRRVGAENYRRAVTMAKNNGWTNTDIARACGVSEAAIRRYWKRIGPSS